jgi:two-component system OmpR family response regulator
MRLLLVEDHPALAEALADGLTRGGFAVDRAADAVAARQHVAATRYDVVVLDIGLPGTDGLSLLREWRRASGPPVLLLTARGDVQDRVLGLDAGADDYVVKPVEISELLARCRAVLRRPGLRTGPTLVEGPLTLDPTSRNAELYGERLPLARREFCLLEQLLRKSGRVVPRNLLEQAIYSFDDEVGPNALEAAVSRLRKVLEGAGAPLTVVTIRGVGWMLAPVREPPGTS